MTQDNDRGVTLEGPTGDRITVKSPVAVTNYVYGLGYRIVEDEQTAAPVGPGRPAPVVAKKAPESAAVPADPDPRKVKG